MRFRSLPGSLSGGCGGGAGVIASSDRNASAAAATFAFVVAFARDQISKNFWSEWEEDGEIDSLALLRDFLCL